MRLKKFVLAGLFISTYLYCLQVVRILHLIKLDGQIIWDFPLKFGVKEIHWGMFERTTKINGLIQDYLTSDLLRVNLAL